MRKLLQSKAVVSALVAVAALAVMANFVSFPKLFGITASARSASEPAVQPAETAVKMPPTSRLAIEQPMWRELFPLNAGMRDPFTPASGRASRTPTSRGTGADSPGTPEFVLHAISHEPGRAYAVVNQQVVAEGEQLSGYTVERIHAGSVELRGPAGVISLTLTRTAPRQKAAIGKPAPADLPAAGQRSSPLGSPR